MIDTATLTCPHCGRTERMEMPTDACIFFQSCAGCGVLLRPKPGECCVFRMADIPCPPVRDGRGFCA